MADSQPASQLASQRGGRARRAGGQRERERDFLPLSPAERKKREREREEKKRNSHSPQLSPIRAGQVPGGLDSPSPVTVLSCRKKNKGPAGEEKAPADRAHFRGACKNQVLCSSWLWSEASARIVASSVRISSHVSNYRSIHLSTCLLTCL